MKSSENKNCLGFIQRSGLFENDNGLPPQISGQLKAFFNIIHLMVVLSNILLPNIPKEEVHPSKISVQS